MGKLLLFSLNIFILVYLASYFDPMALLSGIPVSLYNTWHKLVRYKHHGYFLVRCTKRSRIPKGLKLPFKLQLDKDNGSLQESCRQHSLSASLNILKDISTAVWSKTKILQRQLHFERELLFNNNEETAAKTIWRRIKRQMEKGKEPSSKGALKMDWETMH